MISRLAPLFLCLLLTTVVAPSSATSVDTLEVGVFIAHHAVSATYSEGADWCDNYSTFFALDSCGAQINRIDKIGQLGNVSVWYVIAAFTDTTEWNGVEFGFGDYSSAAYGFLDWGPCYPSQGLEIKTTNWPGPEEGVVLTTTDEAYSAQMAPVYYFAGYAYSLDTIPLGVNPATGFGGTGKLLSGSITLQEAEAFGAMGLFENGVGVCPSSSSGLDRSHSTGAGAATARPGIGLIRQPLEAVRLRPGDTRVPESIRKQLEEWIASMDTASEVVAHDEWDNDGKCLLSIGDSPSSQATLAFSLDRESRVTLDVYDSAGRKITSIVDGTLQPGQHRFIWPRGKTDAVAHPTGVYFGLLSVNGEHLECRRFMLIR